MSSEDDDEGSVFDGRVKPPSKDASSSTTDVINTEQSTHSVNNDGVETVPIDEIDESWTTYFPFDTPYADQVDGINAFTDTVCEYDNMVMEGACGTGKTLIGLTAGINAIRNKDALTERVEGMVPDYSRVLAVTPVKQQLKQFIEEMETINENLTEESSVKTIVMRGRGDVLPYAYVDYHPFDEYHVSAKIDDLRKMSIELIRFDSDIPLNWPDEMSVPAYSKHDYDWNDASEEAEHVREVNKFDPKRAEGVVKILKQRVEEDGVDPLVVNGVEAPYPDGIPHTQDMVNVTKMVQNNKGQLPSALQGRFDPFYVGFHAFERLPFWFGHAENSVMDSDDLFENAVKRGVCPHEAMADMMEHADVLIGNYYHLFDPDTRLLTDMKTGVIDEETICVVDEAHNIEEKVRDILSDSKGIQSFRKAVNDIRTAKAFIEADPGALPRSESHIDNAAIQEAKGTVRDVMSQPIYASVSGSDMADSIEFLNFVNQWLTDRCEDHLDDRFDNGYEWVIHNRPEWIESETIALEDSDGESVDELKTVINETHSDDAEDLCGELALVTSAAEKIINEVSVIDRVGECGSVGDLFNQWVSNSHVDFFREIVLEKSEKEKPISESHGWTKYWTPKYQLYNCIPTDRLREIFSELGSTLLMSATLEPIDVYSKTTGIGSCISPADVEGKDERVIAVQEDEDHSDWHRGVVTRKYPLRFPQKNRLSVIVDRDRYTYSNRKKKDTTRSSMTKTREEYLESLINITQSKGNVLICMPSYGEASWAKTMLEENISKEVLLDQSSASAETDETLEEFFSGDGKVLCTSTRGTITEGVDYDGDKLSVCAVVGISLLPPSDRNKAVEYAYDEELDGVSGRDATNKIPAVRKARQAYGRVLRGDEEKGVRVLVDERYGETRYGGVNQYLGDGERDEFEVMSDAEFSKRMRLFWESVE